MSKCGPSGLSALRARETWAVEKIGEGNEQVKPSLYVMTWSDRDARECMWTGIIVGSFSAFVFCLIAGVALDSWRVRNHERLMREATARVEKRLAECEIRERKWQHIADLADQLDRLHAAKGVSR